MTSLKSAVDNHNGMPNGLMVKNDYLTWLLLLFANAYYSLL